MLFVLALGSALGDCSFIWGRPSKNSLVNFLASIPSIFSFVDIDLSSYISVFAKKFDDNAFCNLSTGFDKPCPPINAIVHVTAAIIGCTPIPSGFKSHTPSS